ncbi:hypothetical protein [Photobacterium proteolyticum]|nr:hypothetical protein [Photobacterium proteolyticum]
MLVFCLGVASFAHAETNQAAIRLALPASVSQHVTESSKLVLIDADAHSDTDSRQAVTEQGSLVWDFSQHHSSKSESKSQQGSSQPHKQHSTEHRDYDPALVNSSRMASLVHHDPEEVQPFYQLAIELPVEPAPSLVVGYCVNFSESLNWMLNTNPPSCRISGWKETNLTYTIYQPPFLRT